jgi:hypothetical protein
MNIRKTKERLGQLPANFNLNQARFTPAPNSFNAARDAQDAPNAFPVPIANEPVFDPNTLVLAQQLAQQEVNRQLAAQQSVTNATRLGLNSVYTPFNEIEDVVKSKDETVTAGIWSDGISALTTYFTSSAQTTAQRRYYADIHHTIPSATGSAVQFSLAFGHALGSGSDSEGQLNDSPSRAIYSQYRNMLLAPTDTRFTTEGSGSTDYIYVINFKRNRIKERLDAGNFELPLCNITSRATNATGSVSVGTNVITLIDDSSLASAKVGDSGEIYNVVSGSINGGVYKVGDKPVYYGLVYPAHGTIVLDGKMLDQQLGFATNVSSSSEGNNHFTLFRSISGSALQTNPNTNDKYGFLARNSEKITSTHYFVRVKNSQYNFSNNATYVTGSAGAIAQSSFIKDPKSYITTIGLYNQRYELVAVAKLSKPLLKTSQREALIRVKLDF